MTLLRPRDPRWQGPARWYLYIDLVKNILLFAFIILVIVEGVLLRSWYMDYHSTVEYDSSYTTVDFFLRIGLALIPDIFSTILTHTLLPTQHFHPVYALSQALIVFCLYPAALALNLIIVYSDETGYPYIDGWQRMCYGEMGMQGLLGVVWAVLVGFACVSVHQWRGVKAEKAMRGFVGEDVELKSGGRKDSGSGEGVDGVVDGSVKSSRVFV